ncbi:MAG TPA: PP0621 family protein [Blastocatellia bacterium]|nr:PP0621 family protein [Blastocatellia bacterium]
MSPLKLIIYFILLLLVIRMIRRFIGRLLSPAPRATRSAGRREARGRAQSSRMVRCQVCGTFVTESSALVVGGSGFCSEACAQRRLSRA